MAGAGKSEKPTPRKLERARKEGRFPSSRELVASLQWLAIVGAGVAFAGDFVAGARALARTLLVRAATTELTAAEACGIFREVIVPALAPLLAAGAALTALVLLLQLASTRMGFAAAKLAPDFKRLNPMQRLRSLPWQNFSALLQALLLLPLFGAALYAVVSDNLPRYLTLPLLSVEAGLSSVGSSVEDLLWKAGGAFVVFGAVDVFRQHRRFRKELSMSKQEIRDEMKETEGNPQMKMRIRRIQRDLLRRRMMSRVPGATAVIVNPTHYAVAIRYRMESPGAPVVVAKGKNYLARRIREIAVANEVPIVENPPLAQALYKSVEVGQEIPEQLFRAVAEILAYIFRLMNGRLPG